MTRVVSPTSQVQKPRTRAGLEGEEMLKQGPTSAPARGSLTPCAIRAVAGAGGVFGTMAGHVERVGRSVGHPNTLAEGGEVSESES